jgi:hypothetical protein
MASFGIEGIKHFANLRASGTVSKIEDITYVYDICGGLDRELRSAGHRRKFYWGDTACWEIDMRDVARGGIDNDWADDVSLFFILTHGNHTRGHAVLSYDIMRDRWFGSSQDWRFGDNWNLEWLLVYGCHTIDRNNPISFWDIFQRLHEFCGAWGSMWDANTTDECGEDVGENLTDGRLVMDAWLDGVSDWWVDNHPMVLAIEEQSTYNGGNFHWLRTTLFRDQFWGHGNTTSDIFPADKYWISWIWAEG